MVSSETAEDALTSVFVTRPDLFKGISFEVEPPADPDLDPDAPRPETTSEARQEEYWSNLTPDRAFLVRVFVDHCVKNKDEASMDQHMPTVSTLALRIQTEYNKLEEAMATDDEDEMAERAFIVGELMRLAVNMDYTDQFGRSTMLQHTRMSPPKSVACALMFQEEMISQPNLPPQLVDRCMDILCKIANSERDLIRLVVDVVSDLREGQGEEEDDTVSLLFKPAKPD